MTAEDMIAQLIELYPKWEDDTHVASMRVSGIKRLIRQAYEEGRDSGFKRARAEQALHNLGPKTGVGDVERFSKLFGFK